LTKIEFEQKDISSKRGTCVSYKCNKRSWYYCNNKGCVKITCDYHRLIICPTCFFDSVLKRQSFDRMNFKTNLQKRCEFEFSENVRCEKRTLIYCASCKQAFCQNHRFFLCMDCANLHKNFD
jgi:hypothetical protein